MNYSETLDYLYSRLPAFQKQGTTAVNWKLEKIQRFCTYLGNPQNQFKTIHVAGTNGKGSSSHYLASILQESGVITGLYTSPHLKDFRERFKVNGTLPRKSYVIEFVRKYQEIIEELSPSFFELTVAMSFQYFAEQKVEWAVIEVGLGGRLDSTNIINPNICLITNIGFDHQDMLGETLEEIAGEKAGIIKKGVPVVISEYQEEVAFVFRKRAASLGSPIYFAHDILDKEPIRTTKGIVESVQLLEQLKAINPLKGNYQEKNLYGVLATAIVLTNENILRLDKDNIANGVANTITNTNLKGRWQILSHDPLVICDTGHNQDAFEYLLKYLYEKNNRGTIYLILGFAKDKKVDTLLSRLPSNSKVYLSSFDSDRSLNDNELRDIANLHNITANVFANVNIALEKARSEAKKEDFIFIGGSTYLVAELNEL